MTTAAHRHKGSTAENGGPLVTSAPGSAMSRNEWHWCNGQAYQSSKLGVRVQVPYAAPICSSIPVLVEESERESVQCRFDSCLEHQFWACSLIGKAPALQAGERGFNSHQVHHHYNRIPSHSFDPTRCRRLYNLPRRDGLLSKHPEGYLGRGAAVCQR